MTTLTTLRTSSTTPGSDKLALSEIAYFRERTRNEIHAVLVRRFLQHAKANGLTKAELARRLGRKPEQLTRWLTAPGNLTIDTISDLLLAMGDHCVGLDIAELDGTAKANKTHPLVERLSQIPLKSAAK